MATRRARPPTAAAPTFKTPAPGDFSLEVPIEPMLAKAAEALPSGDGFLYEPKWDGFRAIVYRRGAELYIQSRDLKPLDRYFPELHEALLKALPEDCVLDGEVVIATAGGLDFDALQLRVHPAASRVAKLAAEMPSSLVVFDALALDGRDLRTLPLAERRARLERALADAPAPVHLTPVTRDHAVAVSWLKHFEGAGLDGVMAKREDQPYQPGKRAMFKIKHARTADCVAAGFRWHKNGPDTLVGSILLGLYDDAGTLQHVGVTSSFTMAMRAELTTLLAPLREHALEEHPWRDWARADENSSRMPGAQSRWSAGKDLSWQPLRIERVCEVKYDHLQGDRFRHAATFLRWRSDKQPADCRYDQLEVTPAYELQKVFGAGSHEPSEAEPA
ncbi:MAG: ATP-dependent ligase [Myxococcaceae bacterium]|nr:ATP-dependent ligase [Myxococcaceae bacterium]